MELSPSSTLKPLTNAHAIRGRLTLKDVERFRNGSVRELKENEKCLKNTRKNTRKLDRKLKTNDSNVLKRTNVHIDKRTNKY